MQYHYLLHVIHRELKFITQIPSSSVNFPLTRLPPWFSTFNRLSIFFFYITVFQLNTWSLCVLRAQEALSREQESKMLPTWDLSKVDKFSVMQSKRERRSDRNKFLAKPIKSFKRALKMSECRLRHRSTPHMCIWLWHIIFLYIAVREHKRVLTLVNLWIREAAASCTMMMSEFTSSTSSVNKA